MLREILLCTGVTWLVALLVYSSLPSTRTLTKFEMQWAATGATTGGGNPCTSRVEPVPCFQINWIISTASCQDLIQRCTAFPCDRCSSIFNSNESCESVTPLTVRDCDIAVEVDGCGDLLEDGACDRDMQGDCVCMGGLPGAQKCNREQASFSDCDIVP